LKLENLDAVALRAIIDEHLSPRRYRAIERESPFDERTKTDLYDIIVYEIVKPQVVQTYTLFQSLFDRKQIIEETAQAYPEGELIFRSWVSLRFLSSSQTALPLTTGVLTAVKGTLLTIMITILFSVPHRHRRGDLAGRIRERQQAQPLHPGEYLQPRGCPLDHLWSVGLAIFVRRPREVHHPETSVECPPAAGSSQWAHHPLRRSHARVAHPAGDNHQRAGGHTRDTRRAAAVEPRRWGRPSGRRSGTTCCPRASTAYLQAPCVAVRAR